MILVLEVKGCNFWVWSERVGGGYLGGEGGLGQVGKEEVSIDGEVEEGV